MVAKKVTKKDNTGSKSKELEAKVGVTKKAYMVARRIAEREYCKTVKKEVTAMKNARLLAEKAYQEAMVPTTKAWEAKADAAQKVYDNAVNWHLKSHDLAVRALDKCRNTEWNKKVNKSGW